MNKELFERSIAAKKLILKPWDTFWYYLPAIVFSAFTLLSAYYYFVSQYSWERSNCIKMFFFFIAFAALSYFFLDRRLRFTLLGTSLTQQEVHAVTVSVGKEIGWGNKKKSSSNYYIIHTPRSFVNSPKMITILQRDHIIYISSICEPSDRNKISLITNRYNIRIFIQYIKAAEANKKPQRTTP